MRKILFVVCFAFFVVLYGCGSNQARPGGSSTSPSFQRTMGGRQLQSLPSSVAVPQQISIKNVEIWEDVATHPANGPGVGLLPRGGALLTGSGNLIAQNIRHIIHAAPGSSNQSQGPLYRPTLRGVRDSIRNSLLLAQRFGHSRVAIPFIGGQIFLRSIGCSREELAQAILSAVADAMNQEEYAGRVVFTLLGAANPLFQSQLVGLNCQYLQNILDRIEIPPAPADITRFNDHRCTAIVNAANMEVTFGGGVSGAIGQATHQAQAINAEAYRYLSDLNQQLIQEFAMH